MLDSAGFAFEVLPSDAPEVPVPDEEPEACVRRLAWEKALDVVNRRRAKGDRRVVLAADTMVVLDGEPMGKPADRGEAQEMLTRLSGRSHLVITGVCVIDDDHVEHRQEVTTEVRFKRLSTREIEAYLDGGEWRDKAGGYGIQGQAAYMVQSISGSYTNVVGLPLCEAVEALLHAGIRP